MLIVKPMGRTALIIHPTLKDRSLSFAEPASDIKTCDHYQQFPLYLGGERHEHYGIPHGFSSRMALERFLKGLFGDVVNLRLAFASRFTLRFYRRTG